MAGAESLRVEPRAERERRAALGTDRIATLKEEYEKAGGARSNLRYGYVIRSRA